MYRRSTGEGGCRKDAAWGGRGAQRCIGLGGYKEEGGDPLFYIFSLSLEFSGRRFPSRSSG